ncbi:MAG TPA: alpha/beta hydrolase, partial [Mariniflexile sp.]
ENRKYPLKLGKDNLITIPVGIARFRYEEPFPPKQFIERGFDVQHWTDFSSGGHFPALEKPIELANDIRNFFRKIDIRSGKNNRV